MRRIPSQWVGVGVLTLGLVAATLMPVFAQDGDRGDRGPRGDRERRQGEQIDREAMQQRMEQMRQRRQEQLRQSLELSEEEFRVVHPMIERVQGHLREQRMIEGMRAGRTDRAGRGGRGGWGRGGDADSLSEEAQAVREAGGALREAIESESISTEELEAKMQALRSARSTLDAALDAARNELREVLTLRQEAVLVAQGTLD